MHDVPRFSSVRRVVLGVFAACAVSTSALAQSGAEPAPNWLQKRVDGLERSMAFFGGGGREERSGGGSYVQPVQASSLADIAVRLDRLENQMRQLNGKIDELQFQGRRNDEALKRFQSDVEFRFQDMEGGKGGSGGSSKPMRRGDAGDLGSSSTTNTASRGGAGAPPASLGQTRGGGDSIGGMIGEEADPNAPMNIRPSGAGQTSSGEARMARAEPQGTIAGNGGPRDQFDLGVGFVQRRNYDQAEATFRDFLQANPKDAKAPEARYWLGESLYQRKKYTDAAENFFAIYQNAPQSPKAPESMLKLGMSLNGMGKKEEACNTIAEAGRKYSRIKPQSDRELKRIAC